MLPPVSGEHRWVNVCARYVVRERGVALTGLAIILAHPALDRNRTARLQEHRHSRVLSAVGGDRRCMAQQARGVDCGPSLVHSRCEEAQARGEGVGAAPRTSPQEPQRVCPSRPWLPALSAAVLWLWSTQRVLPACTGSSTVANASPAQSQSSLCADSFSRPPYSLL